MSHPSQRSARREREASPNPIATLDRAALEKFQTDLLRRDFEPLDPHQRFWQGPIAESLDGLTTETTMTVWFPDGWPFEHARLLAKGFDEHHVSVGGDICLWPTGEATEESATAAGYFARIDEWAERVTTSFKPEDFALDAHLLFQKRNPGAIATIDLTSLALSGQAGKHGFISAKWRDDRGVLEVEAGQAQPIPGRWYFLANVPTPPRTLHGLQALLATGQRNNFNRRHRGLEKGQEHVFLFTWDRELGRDYLALHAENEEGTVITRAIELAPTDIAVRRLRSGPDGDRLSQTSAVIFGLGAIGSHLALRLAECGIGALTLIDGARLRPGDVVRHASGMWAVGANKVIAVAVGIEGRAPWTRTRPICDSSWNPVDLLSVVADHDLSIDATGISNFGNQLSLICETHGTPFVSAALYRGGALARARRQALATDTAIVARATDSRYHQIPDAEETVRFEPGCGSAVNNASPVAVTNAAGLAAEICIDLLAGRHLYPDEVIDIYRPLETPPFDRIGRLTSA